MKKTFWKISAPTVLALLTVAHSVLAQQNSSVGGPGDVSVTSNKYRFLIDNPFNDRVGNNLFSFLKTLIDSVVMPVGGVLCVLAFIYAGFKYVTAQGSDSEIKKAHQALFNAVVGTAVLLGAWVLVAAICGTIKQLGGPACPV